jgi:heme a synthase
LSVLRPISARPTSGGGLQPLLIANCVLVGLTIVAGGFVAGTHAGFDYNTFPLMDGTLVPADYARLQPVWRNLMENIAAVQFDHRLLATITALAVATTLFIGLRLPVPRGVRIALFALGAAVTLQYALGVATLLLVVPVALAAAHQASAVLLLTASVVALHGARGAR